MKDDGTLTMLSRGASLHETYCSSVRPIRHIIGDANNWRKEDIETGIVFYGKVSNIPSVYGVTHDGFCYKKHATQRNN